VIGALPLVGREILLPVMPLDYRAYEAAREHNPRYALRLLFDDIHPAKPKGFCERGTNAPSAIQNRIEFAAMNVIALREGGLTSLAFNRRLEQASDVVIIKH
jgi:hypothetical protein